MLLELNNRRPLNIPPDFNDTIQSFKIDDNGENRLISYIKNIFKSDISSISLILNNLYPEKYLFYRVSMLENEIFSGFKFLSDIIEKFNFPFPR